MRNRTVCIVEDNNELRNALSLMINVSDGYVLLESFANAETALVEIPKLQPDIVLMDINLPEKSGVECVSVLKNNFPEILFLMCTSLEENDKIFAALKAGASGYILKTDGMAKIMLGIEDVFQGGAPMSNSIARKVLESFSAITKTNKNLQQLTERENEILSYMSKGMLNKEIAVATQTSDGTVRKHIENIYRKLHVNTRVEAVNLFMKQPLQSY
jgi:NarL family two-component system response regulator LiaR